MWLIGKIENFVSVPNKNNFHKILTMYLVLVYLLKKKETGIYVLFNLINKSRNIEMGFSKFPFLTKHYPYIYMRMYIEPLRIADGM